RRHRGPRWQLDAGRIEDGVAIPTAPVELTGTGGVAGDGSVVAIVGPHEVVAFDTATGARRWKFAVWRPYNAVFTGDDGVMIGTQGGLIALDARTGTRTAAVCGWRFGLSADQPDASTYGSTTVCEEDEQP
ncbi:MAG: PQQ-binding-like beta-propeller repeat protein, partial [Proteobacteria bacterium]|nr:PQQ-binding-like beta-propeller repeat protein [Pseudomonadota bacterium]